MPKWPKDELRNHGPELSMVERIDNYKHNVRTIRASGCAVPSTAMVDSLDPVEIEMWFHDNAENLQRIKDRIINLSTQTPEK